MFDDKHTDSPKRNITRTLVESYMAKYGREKRLATTCLSAVVAVILGIVALVKNTRAVNIAFLVSVVVTVFIYVAATKRLKEIYTSKYLIVSDKCATKRTVMEDNGVDGVGHTEKRRLFFEKTGQYHLFGVSSLGIGGGPGDGEYSESEAFNSLDMGDECYVVLHVKSVRMVFPKRLYCVDAAEFERKGEVFYPKKV